MTPYEIGKKAWPELSVPRERFLSFIEERAAEGVEGLRIADLYFVCACLEQCPKALRIFETQYLRELEKALANFGSRIEEDARHLL